MRTLATSLLCLPVLVSISFGADVPAEPVFSARPRVAYTSAELAAWKADASRSNEWTAAVARAEKALKEDLTVPEKEGQWIFYYVCPKDNSRLVAQSPEKHVCPTCKTVYTDERTVAAYRTTRHDEVNARCYDLAVGFALTGDDKYAKPVREVLLRLATLYPHWERHDRWGRTGFLAVVGGRRYCQLLDEAVGLIRLASIYDLVAEAPGFSGEDRSTVEEKLLQFVAKEIHTFQAFVGSRNNHQTWFNAAYATVALATADTNLMKEAIYGNSGLMWQLGNSVTEDGLWYEGANAYHFYALQAIQQTLDAAKRAGLDFSGSAKLKSLWSGPIDMAYPDGRIPVFHDSDPASISNYGSFYKWAYGYFKDPVFALYGGLNKEAGLTKPTLKSAAMKGIGVVALRRGTGDGALCAMMDYGIHGDHHGHPDKLGIVLYALGQERILDPGRISYSVPEYETWCRTTVAHNTVVVNEANQEPTTGELWYFEETNGCTACLCASDGAYPGYMLKRFLALTDNLLVDVFVVEGKKKATLDWALHSRGSVTSSIPMKAREELGKKNGYQHLQKIQTGQGREISVFSFEQKRGQPLRALFLDDEKTAIFAGTGIGYHLKDDVPFVIRRRNAARTAFVTVYDLSGNQEVVQVSRMPVGLSDDQGVGLKILTKTGALTVGLDFRKTAESVKAPDGTLYERLLLQSQPGGKP